ncbi:oligosaccharide flippase family protein [Desulfofustis limnaeus]|uniref:Teichoic acid transporter n=1 Tax=Desulfofustis limnaeus TaxID=2740163 RepID=A0ABN6M3Y0_9BACT|nr:oligosaccharide flippase family protein [Desulfofustis limnaeus]BDD87619.1 teichoic acid transporter [Desulfofustis limnaeus]
MALAEKLIKNILSNWTGLIVNIVISFFLAPFVVQKLGNTYYGIWVIMMQFTGYLYLLDFGIRESIIRYVSKFEAVKNVRELNEIISGGAVLYTLIGLLCMLISLLLAWGFPYLFSIEAEDHFVARMVVVICGATIAQALAFNVFIGIVMGLQRYDVLNGIGIVLALFRTATIVLLLSLGYTLLALALIQLVFGLLNNSAVAWYAARELRKKQIPLTFVRAPWAERVTIFKTLYSYSIHVVINNLGQKAIYYTDALVIGLFVSAPAVTFYAIAGNLIEYLRRLILLANSVLNPAVSELESKAETGSIQELLVQGSRFSVLVALPICITYLTMGRNFIGIWMGSEYAQRSGDILFILSVSTLLSLPQNTISSVLYGISKHHVIAKLRLVEAIANLILSLALVQFLGIVGVALGTAVPQVIMMGMVLPICVSRVVGFSIGNYYRQVYLAPIATALPFFVLSILVNKWYLAASMAVFFFQVFALLCIYIVCVYMMCFSGRERIIIRRAIRDVLNFLKTTKY